VKLIQTEILLGLQERWTIRCKKTWKTAKKKKETNLNGKKRGRKGRTDQRKGNGNQRNKRKRSDKVEPQEV
jgi:hypothetical protein